MENDHYNVTSSVLEPTPTVNDQNNLKLTVCETNGFTSGPTGNSESQEAIRLQEVAVYQTLVARIYRQDVVRCNKDWSRIGVVTEVAGDSDSESGITDDEYDDDEDDDDDDEYDDVDDDDCVDDNGGDYDEHDGDSSGNGRGASKSDPLPADQVRVFWMDHSETTHGLFDVTVVDRGFLHGDIVAAASDATGQVGIVVDVNLSVDLLAADGTIIKDVSSRDLRRVREFSVGDYVVLGPWLGRVDDVLDNVTVLFDDGAMSKVLKPDPHCLKPVSKHILEDGHFSYYPGQRVKASSSSVFKNARWLSGLWRASRLEGTITKVTVGSVFIHWIACAGSGSGSGSATTPAGEQTPKNLKLLSCFAHANWQLGDWCLFPLHSQSSSTQQDKGSTGVKHEDPIVDGLVPGDPGSGYGSEEGIEENLGGECPSFQYNEAMDLGIAPMLDEKSGNVGNNVSLECSSCGVLSVSKEPVHESWPIHRKKIRRVVVRRDKKARRKEENFERALVIANIKTRVDVAWQDGKTELGLDSTTLIPIDTPGDHDFVVEQYVVEKASDDGDDTSEVKRVGVVKSVNAKEKTAIVRWLKPVARPEDPREFDKEEVVSVYELQAHPDYDYCYGDFVVRLSPVLNSGQTVDLSNSFEELKQHSPNEVKRDLKIHLGCEEVDETSNDETCAEFSDLSWVGNITGLKDGDIEVTWADEMVSTVGPQAIYVVGRDEDEESIGAGSEHSDDVASWETVSEEEMDVLENAEKDAELQSTVDKNPEAEDSKTVHSEGKSSGRNGPLSMSLAALGFVTRLASGFFSRGRRQTDPVCSEFGDKTAAESQNETRVTNSASSSQESNAVDGNGPHITEHALVGADGSDATESLCSLQSKEPDAFTVTTNHEDEACSFKRFETAKDPFDHYFVGANGQINNERKWLKKVQQDWGVLQKNLPDGIYVRVYEDRMDLLRAAIVGAYGTPYQDGLFIFDFHLPPEYPHVPPSVHYHSGGWRVNPNLYEDGKVCLSLLNTWAGRGNEVWDPSSSSILQVLVSLQGLVLNSKPYFNEAGYDKQVGTVEGEKNSLSYNENTFLLNCKSMMHLLRRPPKDFEELIKDHFQKRGSYILRACDAYKKGYLIGSLSKDASVSDQSERNLTSVGFKLVLAKILPELLMALKKVGADCHEFKHLEQS
ncbi:probable ubiquitin-conjugating enzyme E2 23 [Macadamia integrifolia]|uniref:probable ubiquitin-conjugating enzyme E2 23 n=1 Tax=Macadamia integrifolia TaxID=60698 RepID=UPI001C4F89DA|nr:probable ubiquitin-conjugating enzyme E2 23 [Macadamia integrifolia]XP_042507760.1 probable ubiquitin-conjugating enzyme E2 23 [Macadamia integrifolia]